MQFETRIVNGKPSIFFKEDPVQSVKAKRITTRDELAKKEIRKSMEVAGEADMVRPSPRPPGAPTAAPSQQVGQKNNFKSKSFKSNTNSKVGLSNNVAGKNEIKLTQDQLMALINAIKTNDAQKIPDFNNYQTAQASNHNYTNQDEPDFVAYKPPRVVVNEEDRPAAGKSKNQPSVPPPVPVNNKSNKNQTNENRSLIEKKKQKWNSELELSGRLNQQEEYDNQKFTLGQQLKSLKNGSSSSLGSSGFANRVPNSDRFNPAPFDQSSTSPYAAYSNLLSNASAAHQSPNTTSPTGSRTTMTLGEKKRLQWQQERENQEDFSKFYNSANDLNKHDLNYDDQNNNNNNASIVNQLRKSNSLNNLSQFEEENLLANSKHKPVNLSSSEINHNQTNRFSLLEKKKQQWNSEKEQIANVNHWPFDGKNTEFQKRQKENAIVNNEPDPAMLARLPPQPKSKKVKNVLDEYNQIRSSIEAITAAENKIKQEQLLEQLEQQLNKEKHQQQVAQPPPQAAILPTSKSYYDQSRVPAAMRTSIMFGDVMYDDDIKKAKEFERKKWLQELEEQKRDKLIESQRQTALMNQSNFLSNTNRYNDAVSSPIRNQNEMGGFTSTGPNLNNFEEKSFGRTKNLLDPAQLDEIERKRKQNLQHKKEIEAQIEEKRRMKQMEEELQEMDNMRIENEAREQKNISMFTEEVKKQQPQYQNFDKALNIGSQRQQQTDFEPSVLQGEMNKHDKELVTARSNVTETRANEIYRKMQEAELAAAEEKHKRLLKKLQRGGHDTRQLERKFAEFKAKITGKPISDFDPPAPAYSNANPSKFTAAQTNREDEEKQKLNRIFQMMRENTSGAMPAELTEENLKYLLKNFSNTADTSQGHVPERPQREQRPKPGKQTNNKPPKQPDPEPTNEQKDVKLGKDGKPIWNYKNMAGRKAIPNSMKDPFYQERAKFIEERRKKRQEYLTQPIAKKTAAAKGNSRDTSDRDSYMSRHADTVSESNYNDDNTANNYRPKYGTRPPGEPQYQKQQQHHQQQQPSESIMNLLTKNLAANPIYEEDEDKYLTTRNTNVNTEANLNYSNNNNNNLKSGSNSSLEELHSGRGFVPFMRTNEILDPVHAGSPVPPSRESSAIKRNREKARQAYFQNMKPADYGSYYQPSLEDKRNKDPLYNNGLVRNNPTPRQEQILSQLASLKQSLIQKQKEIASSFTLEEDNLDLDD